MSGSVIVAIQKKYVRKFSAANAFDLKNAKSLEELDLRDRLIFRRMVDRGVFREAPNGKFYLDKDSLALFEERRRKIFLVVLFFVLIVMVWGIFFAR